MKSFIANSKITFNEFCEVITCCGVIDWLRAKCFVGKVFWLNIIIPGLLFTFWQIVSVTQEYATDNKYVSSVSLATVSSLPFPNVTVCNFNRASVTVMNEIGLSPDALSYAYGSLPIFYDLSIKNYSRYEHAWKGFVANNSALADLKTLFRKVGYQCYEIFAKCSWNGVFFDCCEWVTEVINSYGKCFVISPPNTKNGSQHSEQSVPGATRGLKFAVYGNLDTYSSNVIMNNFVEEGFLIGSGYVYEPTLPDPIAVNVGVHAWIALTAKKETFTKPNFQIYPMPCRSNTELVILNETYSKQNCIFDCKIMGVLEDCGCILFANAKSNYSICNASYSFCVLPTISKPAVRDCIKECVSPCKGIMIAAATVSYTKFPANSLRSSIAKSLSLPERLVDSLSVADIYFPNLEIVQIETSESTSIFTFIANVGGQLGVLLGMSICTCVQFFYYVCDWLYSVRKKPEPKRPKRIKTVIINRKK